MTEELKVVLRRSEHTGFGFSLLGTTGPPHVIFDIIENSPAADCGAVEAGDVILKVNETDVHRYTTKEVLKCLRLSDDLITLELKRDPKLKARIKEQLAKTKSPHYVDIESQNIYDYKGQISPTNSQSDSLNSSSSLRYKSPTNLPPRQTSANHSRSSSASSAKIQTSDVNTGTGTGAGIASTGTTSTSPSTCRPSRIPTALKNPQKNVIQHSPQHKRPRPSQIPTKASIAAGAAAAAAANGNTNTNSILSQHSEHSNSKSNDVGGCVGTSNKCEQRDEYQIRQRHQQQQQHEEENNREPLSAPPQPKKAPRFEAYMMTGDLILNLSRTPQSSNLIAAQAKKVDSLRDSPNRSAARANGALAPRASGESSPTSSSSVESPTHSESSDSVNLLKKSKDKSISRNQKLQQQQQQQRNSINNSLSNNSSDRQCRKDSLTNDTLLLCEELDRDEEERDIEEEEDLVNDEYDNDDDIQSGGNYVKQEDYRDNKQQQQQQQQYQQRQQQRYHRQQQQQQRSYELYEADEEDQTNYDITNIVTYNSSDAGYYVGIGTSGNASGINSGEQQPCLVMHTNNDDDDDDDGVDNDVDDDDDDDDDDNGDDDNYEQKNEDDNLSACVSMSSNSLASAASAKQKLRELKHKQKQQQHKHKQTITTTPTTRAADTVSVCANSSPSSDLVDYARETLRTTTTQQNLYSKQHHHRQHHQLYHNHQHHHHHHHHSSSSSSGGTIKSDGTSQDETSFSVPTSPISLSTPLLDKNTANSVPTSPEPSNIIGGGAVGSNNGAVTVTATGTDSVVRRHNGVVRKCDSAGFRTSKSEDHLQQVQREGIAAVIPIDIDEDVNSSLNTLLDTRQDSEDSQASNRDRIVWTYNAPLTPQQLYQQQQQQQHQQQQQQHPYYGRSSPNSHSSSISSSSPHHSDSPASPTSVSSSVMSSSGSKGALGITCTGASGATGASSNSTNQQQQQLQAAQANAMGLLQCPINGGGGGGQYGDQSVSEAISNISSPDYQDDDNLLSSRDLVGMVLSDPSDSDSTILVSDAVHGRTKKSNHQHMQKQNEHKLVIQVRGFDNSNSNSPRSVYSELKDSEDELATLTEEPPTLTTTSTSTMTVIAAAVGNAVGNNSGNNSAANNDNPRDGRDSSPPVSDDGSDVESLHSYHYSPKAVDMPSAIRLAKRLYSLDGFKKSDVSRHLSKNNDFSRAVADEYLKYFNFEKKTLDQSLREFLQQFSLSGETQERERVLVHFSKRFLDCNPGSFNSQDAVHTLTCAIMLLNTDLHGQNIGRKMSCAEFVDNLAELNDGENFPKDILKYLYQAIKSQPLEWALDEESAELQKQRTEVNMAGSHVGQNPFLDIPESSAAVEFKKGYVMRKSCYEANYKKTPFGKRSWKMFYCTLRDLVLFLHKDEHGFRKSQMSDNLHNAIRIHHALATKATDYTKKQHVFRLQTADQAEYLFQTSDSKELQSWVETINFVCAAYSAPPLEGGVGSQKRFQRPLLPSTHTKFLMKEQLDSHEQQVALLENTLSEHKKGPIPSKGLPLQNFKEKESYLQYELRRYKSYVSILNAKMLADQQIELQMSADEEASDTFVIVGTNAAQRSAQVIVAATAVTNQTQLNNNAASGQQQQQQQQQQQLIQQQQQQQQSTNRKKEKRK